MKAIHALEMHFSAEPIHLSNCPAWVTFAVLFVGIPFGLVATVFFAAAIVLYPVALLFGWI